MFGSILIIGHYSSFCTDKRFRPRSLFAHVPYRNMAIIDEFTANILVNGQPCEEYGEEYGEGAGSGRGPKKVVKYIEAISGAPYTISYEVSPLFEFTRTTLVSRISIDGYLLYKRCIHRSTRHTHS